MRADALLQRTFALSEKAAQKSVWWASSLLSPPTRMLEVHGQRELADDPKGEYVRVVREPACIEPRWGYVITERGELLEDSIYPNFTPERPLWRLGTASPVRYLSERLRRGTLLPRGRGGSRRLPVAVSLRHFWEWNYHHFYFDVLGKLGLLREAGVGEEIPIVLGSYAKTLPWVPQILACGDLARYEWIIPDDDEFAWADEVIYCRTQQDYKHKMDFVLDAMGVGRKVPRRDDRVFLDRSDAAFRRISNRDAILPILLEYGFRVVDSSSRMNISEQIDLFANTRYLVAVHGAGLTNVVFRRDARMSVLEMHAANYISDVFERMCRNYGHGYQALAGQPDHLPPKHANFEVSPAQLREALDRMVAGPPAPAVQ